MASGNKEQVGWYQDKIDVNDKDALTSKVPRVSAQLAALEVELAEVAPGISRIIHQARMEFGAAVNLVGVATPPLLSWQECGCTWCGLKRAARGGTPGQPNA